MTRPRAKPLFTRKSKKKQSQPETIETIPSRVLYRNNSEEIRDHREKMKLEIKMQGGSIPILADLGIPKRSAKTSKIFITTPFKSDKRSPMLISPQLCKPKKWENVDNEATQLIRNNILIDQQCRKLNDLAVQNEYFIQSVKPILTLTSCNTFGSTFYEDSSTSNLLSPTHIGQSKGVTKVTPEPTKPKRKFPPPNSRSVSAATLKSPEYPYLALQEKVPKELFSERLYPKLDGLNESETKMRTEMNIPSKSGMDDVIIIFRPYFIYGKGNYLNQTGFFYKICQEFIYV